MSLKNKGQAIINDVEGMNPVTFEVNFSEEHKDCVKITLAGVSSIVKYNDLFSFMFTIASKEAQAQMIPVQEEKGTEYLRQHTVKVKNDMKAGDSLVVNCRIHVPTVIEEQIKSERAEKEKLSTASPYLKDLTDRESNI